MTTRAEQETIIRWSEDDKRVHVWSNAPMTHRKMAKLGVSPTRVVGEGRWYTPDMPFYWRFSKKRKGAGRGIAAPPSNFHRTPRQTGLRGQDGGV